MKNIKTQHADFEIKNEFYSQHYVAQVVHEDGTLLDCIASNDPDTVLSKSAAILEDKYPNALCKIIDMQENKEIFNLKPRHYLE